MGISYNDFWHMNPHIVSIIAEGHKQKIQMIDTLMWQNGLYTKKAFEVVMAHFGAGLSGRSSKEKYFDKPFSQQKELNGQPLTEEEAKKQRQLFVAKLMAMQSNYEINHPQEEKEDGV